MAKLPTALKKPGDPHTAAEYNATTTSINALYDALFEAGIIGVLKTGVLPNSILSPNQFESLGDGSIGLIGFENIGTGGSTLPKPLAPGITYDDVARELSFTHATYPNGIEYRVNGGGWINYTAGAKIPVGTGAVSANYYQARVKAIADTIQASNIVGNALIPSESGSDGFVNVTGWLDIAPAVLVGNNITSTEDSRGRTVLKLLPGQEGNVRVSSCKGGCIILSTAPTGVDGVNDAVVKCGFQQNPVNLKLQAFVDLGNALDIETGSLSGPTVTELEISASSFNFYYGESRTLLGTAARMAGDLYLKMTIGGGGELLNIQQKGFS